MRAEREEEPVGRCGSWCHLHEGAARKVSVVLSTHWALCPWTHYLLHFSSLPGQVWPRRLWKRAVAATLFGPCCRKPATMAGGPLNRPGESLVGSSRPVRELSCSTSFSIQPPLTPDPNRRLAQSPETLSSGSWAGPEMPAWLLQIPLCREPEMVHLLSASTLLFGWLDTWHSINSHHPMEPCDQIAHDVRKPCLCLEQAVAPEKDPREKARGAGQPPWEHAEWVLKLAMKSLQSCDLSHT
jgi:hypothetical protein